MVHRRGCTVTETNVEYITQEPDFRKPAIGDVVAVCAVDWGQIVEEVSGRSEFSIVRGTIYGQVIVCTDEQITVAFQVFETGNVRGALSLPWVCVEQVTILDKAEA